LIKPGSKIKHALRLLPFGGHKPDFLIIGAAKSGTTSLHYYLGMHPSLSGAYPKEIHFFDNRKGNFEKGTRWYESHFKSFKRKKLFFEATPKYMADPLAIKRIYEYKPGIKLIAILRDPVDRFYSDWNHMRLSKHVTVTPVFEEFAEIELGRFRGVPEEKMPDHIRKGIYYFQIKEILKWFCKDQLLILDFNEMVKNKFLLLKRVEDFLGISHFNYPLLKKIEDNAIRNKRKYNGKMDQNSRQLIHEFYKPYNEILYGMLGKNFGW
jgi:hypothetical protein